VLPVIVLTFSGIKFQLLKQIQHHRISPFLMVSLHCAIIIC